MWTDYVFVNILFVIAAQVLSTQASEDLVGYTRYKGVCESAYYQKRPFVNPVVCANHCDRNSTCAGFQIVDNTCRLLTSKCHQHQLDLGEIKNYHPVWYFLKEIPCKNATACSIGHECLPPTGYKCSCVDGFCYPSLEVEEMRVVNYHHYKGTCHNQYPIGDQFPVASLSHCLSQCDAEGECSGFTMEKRMCDLHRTICTPKTLESQKAVEREGRDYFVKSLFHNFTCSDTNDCLHSNKSVCSLYTGDPLWMVDCRCDSETHECVLEAKQTGQDQMVTVSTLPNTFFLQRLRAKEKCVDKHVCCSMLFPAPENCSDADSITCPKSCGLCNSTDDCRDEIFNCSHMKHMCYARHTDVHLNLILQQCRKTCNSCGKSLKDLDVVCNDCMDTLPNCQELANDGLCDALKDHCRRSCGCL